MHSFTSTGVSFPPPLTGTPELRLPPMTPRGQFFLFQYRDESTRPLGSIDSAFDSGDTTPAASYSNERNSSSLSRASLMIFFISQRGSSAECIGTTVVHFVSGFRNVMWLPFCRSISNPAFSSAAIISFARRPGSRASILRDDRSPHRDAERHGFVAALFGNGIAVVGKRFEIDRERFFRVRDGLLVGSPPRLAAG